ncbi:hypothetical protein Mpsy_0165 [Methanolobus psychrophilus R15]|nr:hypothetical protein Mpsy_0165 [Methanolobus psychrophilus R15]
MKKTIAIIFPKGGVGKTTTTMHIARSLGLMKHVVLTIDLCPCGNLTESLLPSEQKENYKTIITGFRGGSIDNCVCKTIYDNVYIVPSDNKLSDAIFDGGPAKMKNKLKILLEASNLDTYDYILLDGPDESGLLAENILVAADTLLIPVNGFYCINEISQLIKLVEIIKQDANPKLDIGHILLTFHDQRSCVRKSVLKIEKKFEDRVLDVKIPFDINLKKLSPSDKKIVTYEPEGDGSKAYKEVAKELLQIWEEHYNTVNRLDEEAKEHINNATHFNNIEDDYESSEKMNEHVKSGIDLNSFFTIPPRTRAMNTNTTIGYDLKTDEKEMISDLMVALKTDSPSGAFQWIMNIFIHECEDFLKERTVEVQNMTIQRIEYSSKIEMAVNGEYHKKRSLMKELFLNPKSSRDDKSGIRVTYRIKMHELETFENLMSILPIKKKQVAFRGILNFTIINYGDLIRKRAEENRKKYGDYT